MDNEASPQLFVNDQTPPDGTVKAAPTRFVIGVLGPEASMERVARSLTEHGVPHDRIHFLCGEGGAAFLDGLGNWFTRAISEAWTDAREQLAEGKVIVGVYDVEDDDVGLVRDTLGEACVAPARYFGTWTNLA